MFASVGTQFAERENKFVNRRTEDKKGFQLNSACIFIIRYIDLILSGRPHIVFFWLMKLTIFFPTRILQTA